jgi:hypothetical protein
MNALLEKYPAWSELVRKTWEQAFIRLAQIVLSVQTLSATRRYEHLFNNHHELIQNTPAKDLATLLGIPDSPLSKK